MGLFNICTTRHKIIPYMSKRDYTLDHFLLFFFKRWRYLSVLAMALQSITTSFFFWRGMFPPYLNNGFHAHHTFLNLFSPYLINM